MSGLAWWSQTAASNATQDPAVGFAEGQAPSSLNDSSRSLMASAAKWRDDISGAITTGGSSTAFTVTSYQQFDNLSRLAGQLVAFTPHTTNTGSATTLNVDSLGAKPLRSAPSVEIPAGTIVQGTPYVALYNNSDAAFYLQGFYGNPYSIPIGGMIDFTGTTAPNSSFVLPFGQAISRTTYSTYFGIVSTTFGTGDGSSTFNVPDLRGRVIAGKDDMGGSAASRLTSTWFGTSAVSLGAVGGDEKNALSATNQLPQFTPSGSVTLMEGGVYGSLNAILSGGSNTALGGTATGGTAVSLHALLSASFTGNAVGSASPSSFRTCQPTIIANKLLRII